MSSLYLALMCGVSLLTSLLSLVMCNTCNVFNTYLQSTNYAVIGNMYILIGLLGGMYAAFLSMIMRYELASAGVRLIHNDVVMFYNVVITLHGLIMIFFLIMPVLWGGIGNLLVPLSVGAGEVAYPRLNNMSIVIFPCQFLIVIMSVLDQHALPGWTLYPPLSTSENAINLLFIVIGLGYSGISSTLTSINFIVTLLCCRINGLMLHNVSIYAIQSTIASILLVLVLPVLMAAVLMLLGDFSCNTCFFDAATGGDSVAFQHLFWFFGHPEVYILILPALGVVFSCSNLLTLNHGVEQSNAHLILSLISIAILGFVVWGHHMYTSGMEQDTRQYFSAITMAIAIPTSQKLLALLC